MPLQRGEVRGYDFNRMVVEFTMLNRDKIILCAISTAAMDDLEGRRDVKPDQRIDHDLQILPSLTFGTPDEVLGTHRTEKEIFALRRVLL